MGLDIPKPAVLSTLDLASFVGSKLKDTECFVLSEFSLFRRAVSFEKVSTRHIRS